MQLDSRVRAAMGEIIEGASILLERDLTPAVLARLPDLQDIRGIAVGFGEMRIIEYAPEGPVAILTFRLFDQPENPLVFDVFVNPSSAQDRKLLVQLSRVQHIHLHVFSSESPMRHIGSKQLNWRDQHRAGATQILDMTRDTTTQWPAAKQRYIRENPLEEERRGGSDN